jgi:hypothetical protein
MHIYQLLLGRKGPRLVKPTRRGILLLLSAQKQKRDVQDYELETNKQKLEIEFHSKAPNSWLTRTKTARLCALGINFIGKVCYL